MFFPDLCALLGWLDVFLLSFWDGGFGISWDLSHVAKSKKMVGCRLREFSPSAALSQVLGLT